MECHWGFKRWLFGIKEYVIDRCLCCGTNIDPKDPTRAFSNIDSTETTDCSYLSEVTSCCNNPVSATLCCPVFTFGHLVCLPVMCCFPTREQWDRVQNTPIVPRNLRKDFAWTLSSNAHGELSYVYQYTLVDSNGRAIV
jgi:hypothetical protein